MSKYLKGHTYRFCHNCQNNHREGRKCPNYQEETENSTSKYGKNNHFTSKMCKSLPGQFKPFLKEESNSNLIKQYLQEDTIKRKIQHRKRSIPLDNSLTIGKKRKKDYSSIECPVCLSNKGKYKTLGCNHQLCNDCWSNILQSDTLDDNCPLCRSNMYSENFETYVMVDKGLIHREGRTYPLVKITDGVWVPNS